jgi:hypothetical protein
MENLDLDIKKVKDLFVWPEQKPIVPEDKHSWFCQGNAILLNHCIQELKPKFILELGSWTGAGSTSFIARQAPDSHIICVDHWSKDWKDFTNGGTTTQDVDENGNIKATDEHGNRTDLSHIETLWEVFLQNTWEHQHHLTPVRAKTDEGLEILRKLDIPVELIYIDAAHHFEGVVHDVMKCAEIWPNAILVGDDWTWESVREGVYHCAKKLDKRIYHLDTVWTFTDELAFRIPTQ